MLSAKRHGRQMAVPDLKVVVCDAVLGGKRHKGVPETQPLTPESISSHGRPLHPSYVVVEALLAEAYLAKE